jgi:outer membrane receptor protein involved in Fe transport
LEHKFCQKNVDQSAGRSTAIEHGNHREIECNILTEEFNRRDIMKKTILFSLLASASLVGISQPAIAQNGPADDAAASDDSDVIVVTARKRAENLIDVPLPVTVATKAQLERDQVYSITDLQRVTPALEVSQTSGGEVNGGARLRGLGTGVFNASVSPSVAFVINQVPQGNLTFPVLFDLAQVEVLRGPQGTLFGQGASAGVINVTTVAPSTDGIAVNGGLDWSDKGTLGSEVGEVTARAGINLPLGDQAAIRLASQYKKETGLQRNTFLGLDNKIKEFALRAHALLKPSDIFTINLIGEYSRQKTKGWNFFAISSTPTSTAPFDPDGPGPTPVIGTVGGISTGAFLDPTGCNISAITPRAEFYCEETQAQFDNTFGGISAVIDWEVSDSITLTSVSSYRELDRETVSVNFSRRVNAPAARNENVESEANQFSQELRLAYDSDSLKLVAGAMYSKYHTETTPLDNTIGFNQQTPGDRTGFSVCFNAGFFCVPVNGPFAPPVAFGYEDTKNTVKALFADATFSLTDQFDIFGGLRYSDYKNTTRSGFDTFVGTRSKTIADNDLSGRIGVSFKPSSNSTLFASFARGYKPPAVIVPTIPVQPITVLKPEKADAFEIGAKTQLGRFQLSANAFHTNVANFQSQTQIFDSAGALISVAQNIKSVKSKGFELSVFGNLSDTISINAGYQYNDVRYPKGFLGNDANPVLAAQLGGAQFINAPKHKFTLSGDFGLPVSDRLEAFVNANLVYKSKVLLAQNGNPDFRYPGHELVNGRIGLRDADGKWTASLFVRNLTKEREPTAYLASDFAGNADGGIRAWPVAGLTARVVGLSVDFGF